MASPVRRRRTTQFQRAADGSMTLLDHLRELRSRLFKASLGIVAGMIVGWFLSQPVQKLLEGPYCDAQPVHQTDCSFVALKATDLFGLQLKIALIIGLIISAPVWLYQLWAFIAPGLHRHERRWAYLFAGIAAPLFALGAWLAYIMLPRALEFLLSFASDRIKVTLDVTQYITFVTNLILLFGLAFEFPLIVMLFNIAGIASAKRLLGWWRIAVFAFFAFSAIAIPTGDPFSMTALGLGLTVLYFGAVLFAYFNDKRRDRVRRAAFGDIGDDEISPIDEGEPITAGEPIGVLDPVGVEPIGAVEPVEPVEPVRPIDRGYDDIT